MRVMVTRAVCVVAFVGAAVASLSLAAPASAASKPAPPDACTVLTGVDVGTAFSLAFADGTAPTEDSRLYSDAVGGECEWTHTLTDPGCVRDGCAFTVGMDVDLVSAKSARQEVRLCSELNDGAVVKKVGKAACFDTGFGGEFFRGHVVAYKPAKNNKVWLLNVGVAQYNPNEEDFGVTLVDATQAQTQLGAIAKQALAKL